LGVENRIRQANPSVPIFHARTIPGEWQPIGEQPPFPEKAVAAFCGSEIRPHFSRHCAKWVSRSAIVGDSRITTTTGPPELQRLLQRALDAGAEVFRDYGKDMLSLPPTRRKYLLLCPPTLPVRIEVNRATNSSRGWSVKVAIFGGTFDPSTVRTSRSRAKRCINSGSTRILFIPAGNPPHKPPEPLMKTAFEWWSSPANPSRASSFRRSKPETQELTRS